MKTVAWILTVYFIVAIIVSKKVKGDVDGLEVLKQEFENKPIVCTIVIIIWIIILF